MSAKAFVRPPNGEMVHHPVRIEIAGRQFEMSTVARGLVAQRRECWEVKATASVKLGPENSKFFRDLIASLTLDPCTSDAPSCRPGTIHFRGSLAAWLAWTKTLDQYIHGERGVTCHD